MAGAISEMEQRHAYSIQACRECHLLRPRGCAGTHGFQWHIDCISSGVAIVAQRPCEPWGVTSNLKYERVVTLVSLPQLTKRENVEIPCRIGARKHIDFPVETDIRQ
jgi:hypothetical protein